MKIIVTFFLTVYCITVSYCDIKYNKIYNWITVPLALIGLILNIYFYGINGFYTSILGFLVGFVILLIPFILKWIYGGDVKLLAAGGALVGPKTIFYSTLWGLILFGIFAAIKLTFAKRIKKFSIQFLLTVFNWKVFKGVSLIEVSGKLPMGFFLSIAILLNWLYFNFYL